MQVLTFAFILGFIASALSYPYTEYEGLEETPVNSLSAVADNGEILVRLKRGHHRHHQPYGGFNQGFQDYGYPNYQGYNPYQQYNPVGLGSSQSLASAVANSGAVNGPGGAGGSSAASASANAASSSGGNYGYPGYNLYG